MCPAQAAVVGSLPTGWDSLAGDWESGISPDWLLRQSCSFQSTVGAKTHLRQQRFWCCLTGLHWDQGAHFHLVSLAGCQGKSCSPPKGAMHPDTPDSNRTGGRLTGKDPGCYGPYVSPVKLVS